MDEKATWSERDLKITAAMYAERGVAEYVRREHKLPDSISMEGASIQLRLLLQRRGTDFELTPDEQLVYEALLRERRLPGGGAHLVSNRRA